MTMTFYAPTSDGQQDSGAARRGAVAVGTTTRVTSPTGPHANTPPLAAQAEPGGAEQRRGAFSRAWVRWTTEEEDAFAARMRVLRADHPGRSAAALARVAQLIFPPHRRLARPLNNRGVAAWPRQGAEKMRNRIGRVRSPNRLVHPKALLLSLGVPHHLIRTRRTRRYLGAWWDANAERLHDLHRLATKHYREKIKELHPDHEGDAEQAAALTTLYRRWRKLFSKECKRRGWNE